MFSKLYSKEKVKRAVSYAVVLCVCLILVHDAYGQAMSSSNYRLQSDSINFGGTRSSTSTYGLEDTFGEVATGFSSSTNYVIRAGYQQMNDVTISLIPPSNVTLSPSIGGVSGGTGNGSAEFNVATDDPAGYTVTIAASTSPALVSGIYSFADYTPTTANPDFTFSVANSDSEFGFSPEGTDIDSRYKDNGGSLCNTGSSDTVNACWDGLSTISKTIVTRTTPNHPNGATTTLKFRATSGNLHIQPDGTYNATSTITVIPL